MMKYAECSTGNGPVQEIGIIGLKDDGTQNFWTLHNLDCDQWLECTDVQIGLHLYKSLLLNDPFDCHSM